MAIISDHSILFPHSYYWEEFCSFVDTINVIADAPYCHKDASMSTILNNLLSKAAVYYITNNVTPKIISLFFSLFVKYEVFQNPQKANFYHIYFLPCRDYFRKSIKKIILFEFSSGFKWKICFHIFSLKLIVSPLIGFSS